MTAARIGGLVQLTWITTSPGTENLAPHYERKTTIPGLQAIFGIKGTYQDLDSLKNHLPKGIQHLRTRDVGLSNYRNSNRKKALSWIKQSGRKINKTLQFAQSMKTSSDRESAFQTIESFGGFRGALWPVISCLDPSSQFPIVNSQKRVREELRKLGVPGKNDLKRFSALSALIGQAGITDAFFLDTAASYGKLSVLKSRLKGIRPGHKKILSKRQGSGAANKTSSLDWQDDRLRKYVKQTKLVQFRQIHKKMTNALKDLCENRFKVDRGVYGPQQFDARLWDYKSDGRHLLIEVKSNIDLLDARLAIGQLFDYRCNSPISAVRAVTDLAVLFPQKPPKAVRYLLEDVGIKVLWFTDARFTRIGGDFSLSKNKK